MDAQRVEADRRRQCYLRRRDSPVGLEQARSRAHVFASPANERARFDTCGYETRLRQWLTDLESHVPLRAGRRAGPPLFEDRGFYGDDRIRGSGNPGAGRNPNGAAWRQIQIRRAACPNLAHDSQPYRRRRSGSSGL